MFKETSLETMQRNQLRRFRLLSAVEGTSLLLLMFVGAPLKHLAGFPALAAVLGPIHGVLVLTYIWSVFYVIGVMDWPKRRALSLIAPAFFPFGTFLIWRIAKRSERS